MTRLSTCSPYFTCVSEARTVRCSKPNLLHAPDLKVLFYRGVGKLGDGLCLFHWEEPAVVLYSGWRAGCYKPEFDHQKHYKEAVGVPIPKWFLLFGRSAVNSEEYIVKSFWLLILTYVLWIMPSELSFPTATLPQLLSAHFSCFGTLQDTKLQPLQEEFFPMSEEHCLFFCPSCQKLSYYFCHSAICIWLFAFRVHYNKHLTVTFECKPLTEIDQLFNNLINCCHVAFYILHLGILSIAIFPSPMVPSCWSNAQLNA